MGHWGTRSFEVDEAADALDAAFERVHGPVYDDLMSDKNPMDVDEVHRRLANERTLAVAIEVLTDEYGEDLDGWEAISRLAFCGVVVRHLELGVSVPGPWRERAADWLESEQIDWDPQPKRDARRRREIERLRRPETETGTGTGTGTGEP